MNYPSLIHL